MFGFARHSDERLGVRSKTDSADAANWDGTCLYGFSASPGGLLYLLPRLYVPHLRNKKTQAFLASGECPTEPRPKMDPRQKVYTGGEDASNVAPSYMGDLEARVLSIVFRLPTRRAMF